MEIGGVKPPDGLNGRSLLALLKSNRSGQVEPERTWVITGRERHVDTARAGHLPYPMRALRTPEFVYIRNFAPDRWPMGQPTATGASEAISSGAWETDTRIGFADMDAGPTKAWLIAHREDPQWKWHYDLAFGKRPAEELYDVRQDPDEVRNLAADPKYAAVKSELSRRLISSLVAAKDPRLTGDGLTFDRPPFTNLESDLTGAKKKKAASEANP
jgi:uncharacterized sulfatase